MSLTLRLLSGDDVRALLPMRAAIDCMRAAFAQLSSGQAEVPVRAALSAPRAGSRALVMPSYLPQEGRFGVKVVTVQPANAEHGLPTIHGLMLVVDAATGRPEALLDAEALTALRTGAASGLATDLLARADARVAALFGAGAQAVTQLEAVCAVRPIARALVFGRTPARAEAFARAMQDRLGIEVAVARAASQLREADVVCTATTATTPVFAEGDLGSDVHLNGVGSYRPDMAEIPAAVVARARVFVDHRASCLAEAGDLIQPLAAGLVGADHLSAELGEVVLGRVPGRTSDDELTLFKSVGNAVQDLAAASFVVARAVAEERGTTVRI